MSNESLQLFYILDSFFYLTPQVWISWLFHSIAKTIFIFLFCFVCVVVLQDWLPGNNKKPSHGKLSAGLLQFCTLG
jgi:hypothetical protein